MKRAAFPLAVLMLIGAWDWARADNLPQEYPGYYCGSHDCTIHDEIMLAPGLTVADLCVRDTPDAYGNAVIVPCQPSYLLCGHKFCDGHKSP